MVRARRTNPVQAPVAAKPITVMDFMKVAQPIFLGGDQLKDPENWLEAVQTSFRLYLQF